MTAEVRHLCGANRKRFASTGPCDLRDEGPSLGCSKNRHELRNKEVEIGATNEKFVTIKSGLNEGDLVVLNPRQHQDIMKIPPFADVNDRDKLIEIGKEAPQQPLQPKSNLD